MNAKPARGGDPVRRSPGSRLLGRIDPESVGLRIAPFTVGYLILALGIAVHPETERHGILALTATVVVAVQMIAGLGHWDQWPRWWQYALPLAQMACLVGLDYASSVNP